MQNKLDDARLALIMSVADLYFELDIKRDQEILHEISKEYPEEGERFMKLMPGFARVAYEEGIEKGIEQGIVQGIEKGIGQGIEQGEEKSKKLIIQKFLRKGFTPEQLAETLEISIDEVKELGKQ
ncbi:hypothetical protein [Cohnella soli]|uniref:hypothetical protein n=1 Tax=Cohnella soli TaxID=425005 RepID=UPI003670E914